MLGHRKLLVLFVIVILTLGLIYYQFFAITKPSVSATQAIEDYLRPKPATAEDWKLVRLEKVSVKHGNVELPTWIGTSIRKVLETETNTYVPSAKVDTMRLPDGTLETSLWSPKAHNKLIFKWGNNILEKATPEPKGGLELSDFPPGEQFNNIRIIFTGTSLQKEDMIVVAYYNKSEGKDVTLQIPYEHTGFSLLSCYASVDDNISVAPKIEKSSGALTSIMIFDYRKGKILAEIPVPKEARNTRPHFSIDYGKKILVVVGYDLNWLMTVDLRPIYNQMPKSEDQKTN